LKAYLEGKKSLKNLILQIQKEPNLLKKIEAWEYKCKHREDLENNDVKLDDLIKLGFLEESDSLVQLCKENGIKLTNEEDNNNN